MKEVVIIDGVRSPIGRFGGGLAGVRPDDLLAEVYKGLMARTGVDPALLEDVYAGCGNQAGEDNRDVARMSVLLAGFPVEVSGVTINRNCSSALEAVNQAAKAIIAGEGDVFIGSGVESMSRAPWSMPKPEKVPVTGHPKVWDTTVGWRYNNPRLDALYPIISLGETAENIAQEMQMPRRAGRLRTRKHAGRWPQSTPAVSRRRSTHRRARPLGRYRRLYDEHTRYRRETATTCSTTRSSSGQAAGRLRRAAPSPPAIRAASTTAPPRCF